MADQPSGSGTGSKRRKSSGGDRDRDRDREKDSKAKKPVENVTLPGVKARKSSVTNPPDSGRKAKSSPEAAGEMSRKLKEKAQKASAESKILKVKVAKTPEGKEPKKTNEKDNREGSAKKKPDEGNKRLRDSSGMSSSEPSPRKIPRVELPNLKAVWPEKTHELIEKKILTPEDTPKKRIPFNLWRCPYCLFIHSKKKLVIDHIDADHTEIVMNEEATVFSAACRMENLAGGGPRILDEVKFEAHMQTLSGRFRNRRDMAAIRECCQNILLEAMVEVGDETEGPKNKHVHWKKMYDQLRQEEPYQIRPDLYALHDENEDEVSDSSDDDGVSYEEVGPSVPFGTLELNSEEPSDASFRLASSPASPGSASHVTLSSSEGEEDAASLAGEAAEDNEELDEDEESEQLQPEPDQADSSASS